MIKIIFESHATTFDNEAKKASGWYDVGLSELGVKQAQELAERCSSRNLDAIFCSDTQRAVRTAMPTANKLHVPVYVDWRLRECNYGTFEHHPSEEVEKEKVKRVNTPFPDGESYQDCMNRMKDFLDWLKTDFEGQTVMIIGHRATHWGLDHFIKNLPIEDCVTQKLIWQPGWEYELN